MLINGIMRQQVRSHSQITDMALPVHIPVQLTVNYEATPLPILVQPAPLPTPQQVQPVQLDHAYMTHMHTLEQLLYQGHLTEAYALWSAFWENWLILQLPPTYHHKKYTGRGQEPQIKQIQPRSPRRPVLSDEEAMLSNYLGRLQEYRRLNHKDSEYATALLHKLTRQTERLMQKYGPPLEDGARWSR